MFLKKIITKISSRRLRYVMEKLVSSFQSSFVLNRSSSDNIIIVQEVLHLMKHKMELLNDLILFSKVSLEQLDVMKAIIDLLKISFSLFVTPLTPFLPLYHTFVAPFLPVPRISIVPSLH
ncbi:hypothetical protein CR513_49426, partial [Mucuna pruriens]